MSETRKHKGYDFIIQTMNGMAYGLFATLIIGTIVGTIGNFFAVNSYLNVTINGLASVLKQLMGVGIGLGIAWSLKLEGLKLISAAVSGQIATYMSATVGFKVGDPLVVYLVVIASIMLANIILRKKTPVDILLIPLFMVVIAGIITLLINRPVSYVTTVVGQFVNNATDYRPVLMGIIIAVVMGMALTAPISSAAIAVTLSLGAGVTGLAGGASVVGCSVQMIGFAIMSRKDNNIGTVISVGLGTSMLQFKNILKKPIIWLPTIIVSAILGPLATTLFRIECGPAGAGMGTSGLVGPINVLGTMGSSPQTWIGIIVLMFVAPAVLVFAIDWLFRKYHLIQPNDLKI